MAKRKSSSHWGLGVVFGIVALLAVAYVTRPSLEKHQQEIRNTFHKVYTQQVGTFLAEIGSGLSAMTVNGLMQLDDYYLFTVGRVNKKVVSVGAYGMVFPIKRNMGLD